MIQGIKDFDNIDEIKKAGFTGFYKMRDLFENCSSIPKVKGVYLVLYLHEKEPDFLEKGTGSLSVKGNPNKPISALKLKWVENAIVLYVGKAGTINSKRHYKIV